MHDETKAAILSKFFDGDIQTRDSRLSLSGDVVVLVSGKLRATSREPSRSGLFWAKIVPFVDSKDRTNGESRLRWREEQVNAHKARRVYRDKAVELLEDTEIQIDTIDYGVLVFQNALSSVDSRSLYDHLESASDDKDVDNKRELTKTLTNDLLLPTNTYNVEHSITLRDTVSKWLDYRCSAPNDTTLKDWQSERCARLWSDAVRFDEIAIKHVEADWDKSPKPINPVALCLALSRMESNKWPVLLGFQHGDLHGNNIHALKEEGVWKIQCLDFGMSAEERPLFYDAAYLRASMLKTVFEARITRESILADDDYRLIARTRYLELLWNMRRDTGSSEFSLLGETIPGSLWAIQLLESVIPTTIKQALKSSDATRHNIDIFLVQMTLARVAAGVNWASKAELQRDKTIDSELRLAILADAAAFASPFMSNISKIEKYITGNSGQFDKQYQDALRDIRTYARRPKLTQKSAVGLKHNYEKWNVCEIGTYEFLHSAEEGEEGLVEQIDEHGLFSLVVEKSGDEYVRLGHIDVDRLLDDPELIRKATQLMADWIKSQIVDLESYQGKSVDKSCAFLVGLESWGFAMAAEIGLRLNLPSVSVGDNPKLVTRPEELRSHLKRAKKVVFVTDVIVSGTTLSRSINEWISSGITEIWAISVLCPRSAVKSRINLSRVKAIATLCESYPIPVVPREEVPNPPDLENQENAT